MFELKNRGVTDDKVIDTVTIVTEHDRTVSFDEILDSVCIENDDWTGEAPWEAWDGWDHHLEDGDYPGMLEARGFVQWNRYNRSLVVIDDDDIVKKWGCNGYPGASKQVRAELIAQVKRVALDQLVKWYTDGWSWYSVVGEYNGYTSSLGGIDSYEYAEEMKPEIAEEIADQMESDGYIITDRPESIETSKSEAYRYNRQYRHESHIMHHRGGCTKRHYRHLAERRDVAVTRARSLTA